MADRIVNFPTENESDHLVMQPEEHQDGNAERPKVDLERVRDYVRDLAEVMRKGLLAVLRSPKRRRLLFLVTEKLTRIVDLIIDILPDEEISERLYVFTFLLDLCLDDCAEQLSLKIVDNTYDSDTTESPETVNIESEEMNSGEGFEPVPVNGTETSNQANNNNTDVTPVSIPLSTANSNSAKNEYLPPVVIKEELIAPDALAELRKDCGKGRVIKARTHIEPTVHDGEN